MDYLLDHINAGLEDLDLEDVIVHRDNESSKDCDRRLAAAVVS